MDIWRLVIWEKWCLGEVGLNVMSIGLDSVGGFGLIEEVGLELG